MRAPSPVKIGTPRIRQVAGVVTLVLLVLLYLDSSIFVGPLRDSLKLVGLNTARYREGLILVALAYPVLLGAAAWRSKALIFPGPWRGWRLACLPLLAVYALSVWAPALLVSDRATLSFYRVLQVLAVPLNIAAFVFLLPAALERSAYERIFRVFAVISVGFGVLSLAWVTLNLPATFLGIPLSQPPDDRGGQWAASGFFVHRNTIGSFLVCLIPVTAMVAAGQLRRRHPARAGLAGLSVLVLTIWLALTFSRSSQLGLAATIGISGLAWAWAARPASAWADRLRRGVRTVSVAGVVVLAILVASLPWLLPRVAPSLDAFLVEALHGRIGIWTDIWEQTADHLWIGPGLFGVEALGPGGVQYGEVYAPHNAFLAQLAYFGIPGLVSLAGLVAVTLLEGWRRRRGGFRLEDAVILGAIAGILVQNLFEYMLTYPVLFSNSFALLVLGYWRSGRVEPAEAGAGADAEASEAGG